MRTLALALLVFIPVLAQVRIAYTPNNNRASNVPVVLHHRGGEHPAAIDQRKAPPIDGVFLSLGTFDFGSAARLIITNQDTDGHVIVDGLQFIPAEE